MRPAIVNMRYRTSRARDGSRVTTSSTGRTANGSASGVARRHPDLKWLRRAGDAPAFATRQAAILDALWQVLAANGKLLYVTCSVFPQENQQVVQAFLARTRGAHSLPLPDGGAGQWLPGPRHDGFFYALIQKQA